MLEVICVLLGAVLTIVTEIIFGILKNSESKKQSARLLYYDILSIFKYIIGYQVLEDGCATDIRYNEEWQTILLNLDYLTPSQIVCIYNLYDAVYNFNYSYGSSEEKRYFDELKSCVNGDAFSSLTKLLKKKAKVK